MADRRTSSKAMTLIALLSAILIAGCASSGGRYTDGPSELSQWVDTELAPYLAEHLAHHPRFKGEPVLIVALDGADVRPDIDDLTAGLRERLLDRLLQTNGVAVAWRPSVTPWEHHRRRPESVCRVGYRSQYFIGIDIAALPGGGHRLSLRALDRGGEGWVSGFGRSWQGRLNWHEQRALGHRQPDAYLRGLRPLPFELDETDLLAGYLARNLDCLLAGQGAAGARVAVSASDDARPEVAQLTAQVESYLRRESRLEVIDGLAGAEIVVSADLRSIHGGLHQAWLTARPGAGETLTAAVDTDAYVRLAPEHGLAGSPRAPGPLLGPAVERSGSTVEFVLHRPARVFAIQHQPDIGLRRLSIRDCRSFDRDGDKLNAGRHRLILPGPRDDVEGVYLLAAADRQAARSLSDHLAELPSTCSRTRPPGRDTEVWLQELDALLNELADRSDWQGLRIARDGHGLALR
ncbi:MAG: hypothetical protein PVI15_08250 [Chromatiales bacterium]|jgi:5-methylcytosine-specific restriction endonuclease McrA